MVVDVNEVNAFTQSVKEAGEGGGGDSDFSTASVTFTNNAGGDMTFFCPAAYEAGELGEGAPALLSYFIADTSIGAEEVKVPLYKGSAFCGAGLDFDEETAELIVTGSITHMGAGKILITGDGTITINMK